jgi:hypothetical protein
MKTEKIIGNILSNIKKEQNSFKSENFFKPIKQTTISGKSVQVFNNNPIPKRSVIKKVYDKIPDDKNIPLQFMTRKQYLTKYIKNQEKKNNIDFSKAQEQAFVKNRMPVYNNIIGRYTTKKNDYYPAAVVVFNDKDNFKNIKGKNFNKFALHEYGHELVEKQGMKMSLQNEETFADNIVKYGKSKKIFSDKQAINYATKKIKI